MDKKPTGKSWVRIIVALVIALAFLALDYFVIFPTRENQLKSASAATYFSSGSEFEKLDLGDVSGSVPGNGIFTVAFSNSFTPTYWSGSAGVETVSYSLQFLDSDGTTPVNLPLNTYIRLLDFSKGQTPTKVYSKTIDVDASISSVSLKTMHYGSEAYSGFYLAVGQAVNEHFQFIIDLSKTTGTLSGDYVLKLSRTRVTASGSTTAAVGQETLTFSASSKTFTLSSSFSGAKFYTNSTNTVNLAITPSGGADTVYSQYGRGVKVWLTQNDSPVDFPRFTNIVATYNNIDYGNDWSLSKPVMFNTNSSSTVAVKFNLPTGTLPNGTYTLHFQLYSEFNENLASSTLNIDVYNTNFKVKLTPYINAGSGYQTGATYYVGDDPQEIVTASTGIAIKIIEDLPNDATIEYIVQYRNGAMTYSNFDASATTVLKSNLGTVTGISGKAVDLTQVSSSDRFGDDDEGVYKLTVNVYNYAHELVSTACTYFVVANLG